LCVGCKATDPNSRVVLRVGDLAVTAGEYNDAFTHSSYAAANTPQGRKQFLESYALKLMILKEAEDYGLDREPDFLKEVEFFWQQAITKRMLDKKMEQISGMIKISDQDVQNYFIQNQDGYFKGKNFADEAPSIRSFLLFQAQNQMLEDWFKYLKSKTKIKADKALFGLQ